jgi:DNA-binding NtrC family response regulator
VTHACAGSLHYAISADTLVDGLLTEVDSMGRQGLLVSWVGHRDLNGWADADPEGDRILERPEVASLLREEKFKRKRGEGIGPLKTAAERHQFEEFHLLSRMPEEMDRRLVNWLGVKAVCQPVRVKNPTDYSEVYQAADSVLRNVTRTAGELNLFLSPGTPTMAAVWVLLGKTLYPATLWQAAFDGTLSPTELPFDLEMFEHKASRRFDLAILQAADSLPDSFDPIVGSSAAIEVARRRAAVVARHDVCVLLLGETGTGKELFAKAIHQSSERRDCDYHPVNCAAIPGQLLESELFGHEKGAFTGADKTKDGLFTMADGGTLFLDEVGECDLGMQAKLLRVLQPPAEDPCQRVFRRVGGKENLVSNVRVIAATNRDLLDMVSKGLFREDLYYRLASVTIRLPSLKERQSDIPDIATTLLQQIGHIVRPKAGKAALQLSPDALRFAQTRRWKGNIRQLYNVLLQGAMFAAGEEISRRDLEAAEIDVGEAPESTGGFSFGGDKPVTEFLDDLRTRLFREAIRRSRENQSEAAKLLGLSPAAVSKFVRQQEAADN